MNASPPTLQIHLLLNVLNRFAFIPGLGEREQAGIEYLGAYLVAVHRLQTAKQTSAQALLQATVETFLGLAQWLREAPAPTVSVRWAQGEGDGPAGDVLPLASRVQAALALLDGRPIREVDIVVTRSAAASGRASEVAIEVAMGPAEAPATVSAPVATRDGVTWIDASPAVAPDSRWRTALSVEVG